MLPDLLTVPEAAQILRVSRTTAYDLAERFLASDGREGLPVIRVGRLLRVPLVRLEQLVGGPLSDPADRPTAGTPSQRLRSVATDVDQASLPFSG